MAESQTKKKTVAKKTSKVPQRSSFAIVETGGKQYLVSEGDTLSVEKLPAKEGDTVVFDKVLLVDDGKTTKIGTPYLDKVQVNATLEAHGRGKKVTIIKFKNKTRRFRKKGHRQPFSKVKIAALK